MTNVRARVGWRERQAGAGPFHEVGVGDEGAAEADQFRTGAEPVVGGAPVGLLRTHRDHRVHDQTARPCAARPEQHLLLGGRLQVHVGEVEAGELGEQGRVQLLVPLGATLLAALITRSHRTLGRRAEA